MPEPRQHTGSQQRRLTAPGTAHDHQQTRDATAAHRLQLLDDCVPFLLAAEEDRSVLFVKVHQAGKRAVVRLTRRRPRQVVFRPEMLLFQRRPQPLEGRLPSGCVRDRRQVDGLRGAERAADIALLNDDREDRDRHRLRIAQFDKTPLRLQPVRRTKHDHGPRVLQALVDLAFPRRPRLDPRTRIAVEKDLLLAVAAFESALTAPRSQWLCLRFCG